MKKILLILASCQSYSSTNNDLVEKITLKNGLKVYYKKTYHAPLIALSLNFKVGSVYEQEGETGATHFLEHLLFQKNKKNSYLTTLEDLGATYNAMTGKEKTLYYSLFHKKDLKKILEAEFNRLNNFFIDKELFEKERLIILEEKKQTESSPFSQFSLFIQDYLFKGSSMAHPIIGSENDLKSITSLQIESYFHKFYDPKNAFVVLTGDLPENYIEDLESTLGQWKSQKSFFSKPSYKINPKLKKTFTYENPQLPKSLYYFYETIGEKNSSFLLENLFQILMNTKANSFFILSKNYDHIFLNVTFNLFSFLEKSFFILAIEPLPSMDYTTIENILRRDSQNFCSSFNHEDLVALKSSFELYIASNLQKNLSLNLLVSENTFSDFTLNEKKIYKIINDLSIESIKNKCMNLMNNYKTKILVENKI